MKKKKVNRRVEAIFVNMPPLSHWPDRTKEFEAGNSEVVEWIKHQPDLLCWLKMFADQKGLIVFDPETKLWRGRNHEDFPY